MPFVGVFGRGARLAAMIPVAAIADVQPGVPSPQISAVVRAEPMESGDQLDFSSLFHGQRSRLNASRLGPGRLGEESETADSPM